MSIQNWCAVVSVNKIVYVKELQGICIIFRQCFIFFLFLVVYIPFILSVFHYASISFMQVLNGAGERGQP